CRVLVVYFFFFFQAEDGIRDKLVTGVQTCALPIYLPGLIAHFGFVVRGNKDDRCSCPPGIEVAVKFKTGHTTQLDVENHTSGRRSEERRVGKECRSRRAAYHQKKKKEKRKVRN